LRLKEKAIKKLMIAAAIAICVSNVAFAANPACEAQATEKKLAGAAKSSFVEENDPEEHRQPIKVAVQPLVLADDVARGFDEASEGLRRCRLCGILSGAGHDLA
jgi:hypothetical protein